MYYAVGRKSLENARKSISSLLVYIPTAKITVYTDNPKYFSGLRVDTMLASATYNKTTRIQYLLQSKYKKTFYIDSDTCFQGSCDEMFGLLDRSDLLLAESNITWLQELPNKDNYPYYNSGVIGYRLTQDVEDLFKSWATEMNNALKIDANAKDEPILRRLLHATQIPVGHLPNRYNYRLVNSSKRPTVENGVILHGDLSGIATSR